MLDPTASDSEALAYVGRWCNACGEAWKVETMLGRGGTAPVFLVRGPDGPLAFKLLDQKFSEGDLGRQTERRIARQVELGNHGCRSLITCHNGGRFEDRLFLLMDCAEGQELEKCLADVPRAKIRTILTQVAQAAIFLRKKNLTHRDIKSANIFVSDDFDRATVLDLSVLREINDPIGIGTDHDNQLPVVATSRYTPPEYLFRLQAPGPDLWHGVDVYQLGGLLHDLIMRQPMFSAEYASSSENRYRFAWIVATVNPVVQAEDVDPDLVLLARRALDKNWDRRRLLRLEDFLVDTHEQSISLAAIGISPASRPTSELTAKPQPSTAQKLSRSIEDSVSAYLNGKGLTATHHAQVDGGDLEWKITWTWEMANTDTAQKVNFWARLILKPTSPHITVGLQSGIAVYIDEKCHNSVLSFPDVVLSDDVEDDLSRQIIASMGPLSSAALRNNQGDA